MTTNTRMSYMYRDAGNNKVVEAVVFSGQLTTTTLEKIQAALLPSEGDEIGNFIPGIVGLRDMQNKFNERHIALAETLSQDVQAGPVRVSRDPQLSARLEDLIEEMRAIKPIWWPDDTAFHEVTDLEETMEDPTDPRSIEDFAAEIAAAHWDAEYLPPFHAEMVANYEEHLRNTARDEIEP